MILIPDRLTLKLKTDRGFNGAVALRDYLQDPFRIYRPEYLAG